MPSAMTTQRAWAHYGAESERAVRSESASVFEQGRRPARRIEPPRHRLEAHAAALVVVNRQAPGGVHGHIILQAALRNDRPGIKEAALADRQRRSALGADSRITVAARLRLRFGDEGESGGGRDRREKDGVYPAH